MGEEECLELPGVYIAFLDVGCVYTPCYVILIYVDHLPNITLQVWCIENVCIMFVTYKTSSW